MKVYRGYGETPEKAFQHIWTLLRHTGDYELNEDGDGWEIVLRIEHPAKPMGIVNP